MGQSSVSKPSDPILGEVEEGADALTLLTSREEYTTSITMMIPSSVPLPPHPQTKESFRRKRRAHRLNATRKERSEDEEEDCVGSSANLYQFSPQIHETVSKKKSPLCVCV